MQDQLQHQSNASEGVSRNARIGLVFAGFAIVAGALLLTEHRAHVLGLLVWLPLIACLLMHVFMHGGHHHHDGGHDRRSNDAKARPS